MKNQHIDQFLAILKKNKIPPIYPFLEQLSHKERRALAPSIKKQQKFYEEFIQNGNSWRSRGSMEQQKIVHIALFVCSTGKEYERQGHSWLEEKYIKRIFEFYIPDWFGAYINSRALEEGMAPFRMEYDWMMDLQSKKILEPSGPLIVKILPQFLYDSKQKKGSYHRTYTRNDTKLLKYPETLAHHIWLFFEEESTIHWTDQYMNSDDNTKDLLSWKQAFKVHCDAGRIDRKRLLRSTLETSNMNFNQSSTGWFIDLFLLMEPSPEELLKIQDSLFGVFNSPHSKPTNTVLRYFKKLCLEKGFLIDEFLASTPILLTSEVKTTVTSTLMILEKLAKKHPNKSSEICNTVCQAFVSNDANIQVRAAKIIAKYGDPDDMPLCATLGGYADFLMHEPHELLARFLAQVDEDNQIPEALYAEVIQKEVLSADNKVIYPESLDDLMFLASAVFDHNDELHLDIFPAALVQFHDQISQEQVHRFEPSLQRAYKIVMGDLRASMGNLDHMLAVFFIDYCGILIKRFPKGAQKLKTLKDFYHKKEKERMSGPYNPSKRLYPFKDWFGPGDSKIYKPFYKRLLFILKQLREQQILPILSTPTHYPYWIDPMTLVQRVKCWQEAKVPIGHADMQFAISRCYSKDSELLLPELAKQLTGEVQRVLSFLMSKESSPEGPFKTIAHWFAASIVKNPESTYSEFSKFSYSSEHRSKFTGDFQWKVGSTEFQNSRWDYKKSKMVNFTDYRKMMKIDFYPKSKSATFLESVFKLKTFPKLHQGLMLYEEIHFRREWYETSASDVKRFYGMLPNNPEILLAKICDKTLRYPEIQGETFKRMLINTLEVLLDQTTSFRKMAHLLLSGALICSDKTARSLAAEVWVYGETHELINSQEIGGNLGKHFIVEFAPLKRFTDLIMESMLRVSTKHDERLQMMIEIALISVNEGSVRGLKKLLEIYGELLRRNNSSPLATLDLNLELWSKVKSLSKSVKDINKYKTTNPIAESH